MKKDINIKVEQLLRKASEVKSIQSEAKGMAYLIDQSDKIGIVTSTGEILLEKEQALAIIQELAQIMEDKSYYSF